MPRLKKRAKLPTGTQYAMWRSALGAWLAEQRRAVGLTQEDVAAAIGTRPGTVSAFECGRLAVPTERYRALADVLKVPDRIFAKVLLRLTDPDLFGMMFGLDDQLAAELRRARRVPRACQDVSSQLEKPSCEANESLCGA